MTPEQTLDPPPMEKRDYVRGLFSDIAPRYDLLNRVLSMNIDRSWRRRAIARLGWEARPGGTYLDACAGTLDVSRELATRTGFRGRIVATDFALPMLQRGVAARGLAAIAPAVADTLQMPVADGSFDGAIVGFGIRNLADLDAGFRELARVLKPGARLVVLDFCVPRYPVVRQLYMFYFRRILPVIGRAVSGHPTAYTYLPESVINFPDPRGIARHMEAAGLKGAGFELMTAGVAAVSWATR